MKSVFFHFRLGIEKCLTSEFCCLEKHKFDELNEKKESCKVWLEIKLLLSNTFIYRTEKFSTVALAEKFPTKK